MFDSTMLNTSVLSGAALSYLAMSVPSIWMVSRCQVCSRFQSPMTELMTVSMCVYIVLRVDHSAVDNDAEI